MVTNETVAPLYPDALMRSLDGFKVASVVLPDGEAFKNWETLQLIFDGLLSARHDRRTTVVALGGGVIGDLAALVEMGFNRVVFALPPADADKVLPLLDRYAEIGFALNG